MILTNIKDVCPYSVSNSLLQYEAVYFGSYVTVKGET